MLRQHFVRHLNVCIRCVLRVHGIRNDLENRHALNQAFERYTAIASRREMPLLLSVWDLNNLKAINDRSGHVAGDALLKDFVRTVKLEARLEDVFFRIGGDEFVGLHLGLEDTSSLLVRVHARFADVAVGCAVASAGSLESTLALADDRMYVAKARMKAKSVTEASKSTLV